MALLKEGWEAVVPVDGFGFPGIVLPSKLDRFLSVRDLFVVITVVN